ncbi:MAG: STAS/SEC14 domain-containing protein [bacterium]
MTLRPGYVAISFSGDVDRESVRGLLAAVPDALATIQRTGRLLFEFSEMESFDFDPLSLGETMQQFASQGLRLAICSANPEFFGVGRQIAQFSGVEGAAIAVFKDQPAAIAWLLGLGNAEGER